VKVRVEDERLATGTPPPVPVKVALCVLPVTPPALSVTVRVALNVAALAGVKVTLIMQELPAATGVLVEQVVPGEAMAKSLGLVPPIAMLAIVRAELVGLLSVKGVAALVVPTVWVPKFTLEGESETAAVPVPLKLRV